MKKLLFVLLFLSIGFSNEGSKYWKIEFGDDVNSQHFPRTAQIELNDTDGSISFDNCEIETNYDEQATYPFPFGVGNNCIDVGWFPETDKYITFAFDDYKSINLIRFYHTWDGGESNGSSGYRNGRVNIYVSEDELNWMINNSFIYEASNCGWHDYSITGVIYGCTDETACNYHSGASISDNDSCVYEDDCGICNGNSSTCSGYIQQEFEYCIDIGANLISSPCEQEIPITQALPLEIANNLNGIIGQGVAANNQNGEWQGSLNGLGGGNGYWFQSNVNACFNYNCAEN